MRLGGRLLSTLGAFALLAPVAAAEREVVVDFESAVPLLAEQKANRVPRYEEKGTVFTLAHDPKQTKGKGLLMFFTHLSSGHKGILSAMATEPIPVRATFPEPASSASVVFWGATGTPVVLEAFAKDGRQVDRATLPAIPARQHPSDPVPLLTLSVHAPGIAYIEWSGQREGEYLAADEIRFTPAR